MGGDFVREADWIEAERVAIQVAKEAGAMARKRFGSRFVVEEKGNSGDLVTEVDEAADQLIVDRIRNCFPHHGVYSEEQGNVRGGSEWTWLVDPLDGTNNYVLGIPLYGVCLTLLYQGVPELGVIHDSHLEKTYVARKGMGATVDGKPMQLGHFRKEPHRMTVGWIQGHHVKEDSEARRMFQALDRGVKRTLRTWAPALIWCMAARGDVDAIVLYDSEGEDLYAGVLMMQEAGGMVMDFDGHPFSGRCPHPYLIACHPDQRGFWLDWIRQVRKGSGTGV
jgi:myo-inositol-1(or 4)-monophosphatase